MKRCGLKGGEEMNANPLVSVHFVPSYRLRRSGTASFISSGSFSKPASGRNPLVLKPRFLRVINRAREIRSCAAAVELDDDGSIEIDMVRSAGGIYSPDQKKVMVLWDIDDKPPRSSPYEAAMALKKAALVFGEIMDVSAFANRLASPHISDLAVDEDGHNWRREMLEKKGLISPTGPFFCTLCGVRCRVMSDLETHFKKLHDKEHNRKMDRINSLKGKRRKRYEDLYALKKQRYEAAAKDMFEPKEGDKLVADLRRAGVMVRMVQDKKEAVYRVMKRKLEDSLTHGVSCLFLVSDDLDFSEMLMSARSSHLCTVVSGDDQHSLGRHADHWIPWEELEDRANGPSQGANGWVDGGNHSWTSVDDAVPSGNLLERPGNEVVGEQA